MPFTKKGAGHWFWHGNVDCKALCTIWGQDFSQRMIAPSQAKMPNAKLYYGDFAEGLAEPLTQNKYDAIIATYALHHLSDRQKIQCINSLLPLLHENRCINIGDVAFATRSALEPCRDLADAAWDDDEIYFVANE